MRTGSAQLSLDFDDQPADWPEARTGKRSALMLPATLADIT